MQLSDAGRLYFERCQQALSLLDEAARTLSLYQEQPEGLIRISVPTTYGHHRVLPLVEGFMRALKDSMAPRTPHVTACHSS